MVLCKGPYDQPPYGCGSVSLCSSGPFWVSFFSAAIWVCASFLCFIWGSLKMAGQINRFNIGMCHFGIGRGIQSGWCPFGCSQAPAWRSPQCARIYHWQFLDVGFSCGSRPAKGQPRFEKKNQSAATVDPGLIHPCLLIWGCFSMVLVGIYHFWRGTPPY